MKKTTLFSPVSYSTLPSSFPFHISLSSPSGLFFSLSNFPLLSKSILPFQFSYPPFFISLALPFCIPFAFCFLTSFCLPPNPSFPPRFSSRVSPPYPACPRSSLPSFHISSLFQLFHAPTIPCGNAPSIKSSAPATPYLPKWGTHLRKCSFYTSMSSQSPYTIQLRTVYQQGITRKNDLEQPIEHENLTSASYDKDNLKPLYPVP